MIAPGEADAAGQLDSVGLPERADLPERANLAELPAPADVAKRADLAELPDPAGLAAPTGQLDLADLSDSTGWAEPSRLMEPVRQSELPDETELARAVLETIREASAGPRLIGLEEILERLRERGLAQGLETAPQADARLRLAAIVADLPEIASLASRSGRTLYHDPALLSRAYARLLDDKDVPEVLVAEAVRSNSREYPRPVPVEFFEKPPFDLTPPEIADILESLAAKPAFGDIATIQTSTGTAYLFSSRYLPRAYAAFLAEQDATLVMNP
ncbi:MAG: hypothetical protein B193_0257 [Solidesulfovibrio magneticus str. Maddingley MBC34]|uniref:Uncharacterized protein n=1 Tax=Solidesulfovibrio magneticus str. Maddingley MBC34 TaxID=1206767 RepID=K6GIT1_9BACT|nr:MAG: hypothetical protein B193_0257 [Solidesulfovibrio magneticus str. Maddingley MBC34]